MNTREISINVENEKIKGTVIDPEVGHLAPAILFIHGWTGERKKYVVLAETIFAKLGFFCLAIDLRGHGESDGNISEVSREDNLADVVAAYRHLYNSAQVDKRRMTVISSSYGAYLAMLLTDIVAPEGLILRAPALYRDAGFKLPTARAIKKLGDYRRRHVDPWRNRALKALRDFEGHVLVIAGGKDDDVPAETIHNVTDALREHSSLEFEVIPDADHRLSEERWRGQCNETIAAWLIRTQGMA